MAQHISGQDIDVLLGPIMVNFEKVSLNIEDSSKAVHSKGLPNGHVRGRVSASGEIEIDTNNLMLISAAAAIAGSWEALNQFDLIFGALAGETAFSVIASECLIKISKLIDASAEGGEKLMHTIPFEVTGKDFIRINGTPYVDSGKFLGLL